MFLTNEEKYTQLIYKASGKRANWAPEVKVNVGDYGRVVRKSFRSFIGSIGGDASGSFVKEGNIFEEGMAEKYGIEVPVELGGTGCSSYWILSDNAVECSAMRIEEIEREIPDLSECEVKAGYNFTSGRGAALVMLNESMKNLDYTEQLVALLKDENMRGKTLVSMVHNCSSYARVLTSGDEKEVVFGLKSSDKADEDCGGWICSGELRDFRSNHHPDGKRAYTPLYKLVDLGSLS